MNKNVVVTGGAGFIGRALVARCVEAGLHVSVIDNLCAGRLDNLQPYLNCIDFHRADILDLAAVDAVMKNAKPSVVFHLAAHHFIPFCDKHPNETIRVNVEGTYSVLSSAARHGVGVAVVASTGAIYPSQEDVLNESLEPVPPDVYGLSKLMAEQVTRFIARTTATTCVAARLFNAYGPFETNPHLIPDIIDCLRHGPTVSLGNIHTKRDYIYVDDVAMLLHNLATNASGSFTAVNVGTGIEYSAEEIVREISRILGYDIKIAVDASRVRAVDKLHQRADTTTLKATTGMQATHGLADGLRSLLAHEGLVHMRASA